ncbi:MAG TPA: RNA 2',3'-cyclic phosphodiesterase [Adhaeribacter sp.]|nr:RNA 2',3'-cyclic phosphodiesterase [Adhaeribacter sp.]
MKNNLRLFVAAPLPHGLVQQLETYLEPYTLPGVRLVPEENWHLTYFFIGNVPAAKLSGITEKLASLSADSENFTLKLLRVAPGPDKKAPRLVWAQFAENKTFEKICRAITIGLGEKIRNQHPIPHITLARLSKDHPPKNLPVSPATQSTVFEVSEMALWQSELGQPHPRYTVLEHFPFGANL